LAALGFNKTQKMIQKSCILSWVRNCNKDFTACRTEPKTGFRVSAQQLEHVQLNGSCSIQV